MRLKVVADGEQAPEEEHRPKINEFSKEIVENMRKSYGLTQIRSKWEQRKKQYEDEQRRKDDEAEDMIRRGPAINKRSLEQVKVNQALANNPGNIKGI